MSKRLYDDNLYLFDTPQRSYWEATAGNTRLDASPLKGDQSCDVAVIGGGYTGLSAALHLARDYNIDVRVLEAGHIGWGASGRNGGFCCPGGTGVDSHDMTRMVGLEAVREYYRAQVQAVELVRALAEEEAIDLQSQGDAELVVAHTAKAFDRIKRDHNMMSTQLGLESELLSPGDVRERYYDSAENHGGLVSKPAFGLHPLRYCQGLAAAAERRGAVLHQHSEVLNWSKTEDGNHRLSTAGGMIKARRVIFAANGFMPEDLHEKFYARTLPVISAIIVTRPLSDDERAAHRWVTQHPAINSRRILNYFRMLPDNRFMFGGRGHTTGHPQGERETYRRLQNLLAELWPHWAQAEIEYRWHGLICMTGSLSPALGQLDDDSSVLFAHGYHGNGVNNATWSGKQLADWIGTGSSPELPGIMRGIGRKYPLAGMRLKYLQLGIAVSSWLDRTR
ncbi:MAG: FAD-binding oxidoreductase [Gammaproteobacteria bacterium]|nr:FAD-binding oxidoreductase [Gammaproteobacteria bacterium]